MSLGGGAIVATATMGDVGIWAEIMSWLRRKPVWSIPDRPSFGIPMSDAERRLTICDITAMTQKYIVPKIADEFFRPSPLFMKLRQPGLTTMTAPKNAVFPLLYGARHAS